MKQFKGNWYLLVNEKEEHLGINFNDEEIEAMRKERIRNVDDEVLKTVLVTALVDKKCKLCL